MKRLKARRADPDTAAIVDRGIQLQEAIGTTFAAKYLNYHKVSVDVTMRVLSRPWERRNSKQKAIVSSSVKPESTPATSDLPDPLDRRK